MYFFKRDNMKFNKLMIFSIILIAILALGAVNATELDGIDDMGNVDASIDEGSVESDDVLIPDGSPSIADDDGESSLEDYDYDVSAPDVIYPGDKPTANITMPDDANGTFRISFDNDDAELKHYLFASEVIRANKAIYFDGYMEVDGLEYGKNHTLHINYYDDGKYKAFNYSCPFFLNYIKFEIPDEISTIKWGYQWINVFVPYNDTAKLDFFVNGKECDHAHLFNGNAGYSLAYLSTSYFKEFGTNTYEIRYYDGKYPNITKKGTVDVVFHDISYFNGIVLGSGYDEDLRVNLPFDAFGSLRLVVDGNELIPEKDYNDERFTSYVFNLSSLECKHYDAQLVYSGDGYYPKFNRTVSFDVDYLIDVYPDSYTSFKNVGDKVELSLPLDFPINRTFELKIWNETFEKTFYAKSIRGEYSGGANFDISELPAGIYDAQVIYGGDSRYPARTVDLTLNKSYTIYCNSWHSIFEDTYVTLKLPKDAYGSLLVFDDRNLINITIPLNEMINGTYANYSVRFTESGNFKLVNCTIPNSVLGLINPESHYIDFSYDGNDYLVIGTDNNGEFDANYICIYPKISMPDFYVGKEANFTFEMPKDVTGRLLLLIEDKAYYNGTLKNGKATVKLPNTKVGDFYWFYEYSGDYGSSCTTSDLNTFRVIAKTPIVNITTPSNFVKNCYNTIKFTFPTNDFNGNVRLKLDYGNYRCEYYTVKIAKGIGSIKILPKYQGKVRLSYQYAYKHYAVTWEKGSIGDYKVFKLSSSNVTKYYTDSKKLSVKIVDNHNRVVKDGQLVKFYLKGKKIGNATTKNGVASFKINLAPGTYKIKIYYKGAYVFRKVIVKPILTFKAVKVKRSAKKLVLKASLKKVNNKYIVGKYITFKFNGKTYKAKTNKYGVAKVTIKRAVLKKLKIGKKVSYQATYLRNNVKRTAKVLR